MIHIPVDVHFVRDEVQAKTIKLRSTPSADMLADIFTKPLAATKFAELTRKLSVADWLDLGKLGKNNFFVCGGVRFTGRCWTTSPGLVLGFIVTG